FYLGFLFSRSSFFQLINILFTCFGNLWNIFWFFKRHYFLKRLIKLSRSSDLTNFCSPFDKFLTFSSPRLYSSPPIKTTNLELSLFASLICAFMLLLRKS